MEPVTYQELAAVGKGDFHVSQLLPKILTGLCHDFWRNSIDRSQCIRAMAAHDVKAGRIEFGHDKEAPFEPCSEFALGFRN